MELFDRRERETGMRESETETEREIQRQRDRERDERFQMNIHSQSVIR